MKKQNKEFHWNSVITSAVKLIGALKYIEFYNTKCTNLILEHIHQKNQQK